MTWLLHCNVNGIENYAVKKGNDILGRWAKTQWEEKDLIDRKLRLREGRHDYDYKGEQIERRQSAVKPFTMAAGTNIFWFCLLQARFSFRVDASELLSYIWWLHVSLHGERQVVVSNEKS